MADVCANPTASITEGILYLAAPMGLPDQAGDRLLNLASIFLKIDEVICHFIAKKREMTNNILFFLNSSWWRYPASESKPGLHQKQPVQLLLLYSRICQHYNYYIMSDYTKGLSQRNQWVYKPYSGGPIKRIRFRIKKVRFCLPVYFSIAKKT